MKPIDYALFGRLVWEWIAKQGGDYCGDEDSEYLLPMAQKAGLVARVKYDPAKHGENIEAERGDEIWYWGSSK